MSGFTIAAAQVASIRGDVDANLATHMAAIREAAGQGVDVLIFPELSLTGYEPELAAGLAIEPTDRRLDPLAELASQDGMQVVVGAPLRNGAEKPLLGALILGTGGGVRTYAKMYLGSPESAHFAPGVEPRLLEVQGRRIGLAICADASEPSHPQGYAEAGAEIYAAGVFLNAEWYATDMPRLSGYAVRPGMAVLLANHGASVGTYSSVGRSAVWAPGGRLLAEAAGTEPALITATIQGGEWRGRVVPI